MMNKHLIFRAVVRRPEKTGALRGTVYVLALENGCYYIGWTTNLKRRLTQHFRGQATYWTKLHQPLRLLETIENATLRTEDEVTERYIQRYTQEKVRGGIYVILKYDPGGIIATIPYAN